MSLHQTNLSTSKRGGHEWTLWPNRALGKKTYRRLLIVFTILLIAGAIRSVVLGAWPVAIFLIVDLAAIWLALSVSIKRTKWRETITLTANRLIITRSLGEKVSEIGELSPRDATLNLTQYDGRHRLEIRDKTRLMTIGSFLNEKDLTAFRIELENALQEWRTKPMAVSC